MPDFFEDEERCGEARVLVLFLSAFKSGNRSPHSPLLLTTLLNPGDLLPQLTYLLLQELGFLLEINRLAPDKLLQKAKNSCQMHAFGIDRAMIRANSKVIE